MDIYVCITKTIDTLHKYILLQKSIFIGRWSIFLVDLGQKKFGPWPSLSII